MVQIQNTAGSRLVDTAPKSTDQQIDAEFSKHILEINPRYGLVFPTRFRVNFTLYGILINTSCLILRDTSHCHVN